MGFNSGFKGLKSHNVKCVSPLNGTVFETNELPYFRNSSQL